MAKRIKRARDSHWNDYVYFLQGWKNGEQAFVGFSALTGKPDRCIVLGPKGKRFFFDEAYDLYYTVAENQLTSYTLVGVGAVSTGTTSAGAGAP